MNKFIQTDKTISLFKYPIGLYLKNADKFIFSIAFILDMELAEGTYINLWVRGSSGSILGTMLFHHLPGRTVNIFYVRKDGESRHDSGSTAESVLIGQDNVKAVNIILDDHISTGQTIEAIFKDMEIHRIHKIDYLIVGSAQFLPVSMLEHIDVVISNYAPKQPLFLPLGQESEDISL